MSDSAAIRARSGLPRSRDLVYDIGMHRGEDTARYLEQGYRVVAVEANPAMVGGCRRRFADSIRSGRLTIVEGAIAAKTEGSVTFYVDANTQWGSIDPEWVRKKEILRPQREIVVPVVDLAACMRQHGVPHYMKIDIEGADRLCVQALLNAPGLPEFLSMEAELFDFNALVDELDMLERLGYTRFAVVRQGQPQSPSASSGPFGDDLSEAWGSRRQAIRRHRRAFKRRRLLVGLGAVLNRHPIWLRHPSLWRRLAGYYDTHARL